MSSVEHKIACFILNNPKEFVTYGLAQFSMESGASQGSVINFANKYADGGFPELKLAVAACLTTIEKDEQDKLDVLGQRIYCAVKAFGTTHSQNSQQTIKEVAELILNAKKVEIYGVYRSAVIATDFYYQLLQMGIPANFVSDVLTCAVSASLLQKDSLVVAVSSTGRTKDVIDAVKLAKANGVKVACITANKNSPLAKLSDYVLIACASEANGYGIRLSQLLITDALCQYVQEQLEKAGKKSNIIMQKILDMHNVSD